MTRHVGPGSRATLMFALLWVSACGGFFGDGDNGGGADGGPTPTPGECARDADCDGDRVCDEGRCVGAPGECAGDGGCPAGNACRDGRCVREDECVADGECARDERCLEGLCVPAAGCESDDECPAGTTCQVGLCLRPNECRADGDCDAGEQCEDGRCVGAPPECVRDGDCGAGRVCREGVCVDAPPECVRDGDCGADEVCSDGRCVTETGECRTDGDCRIDEVCRQGLCVLAPTGCDADSDCAAGRICEERACVAAECTGDLHCAAGEMCAGGRCVPERCVRDADCGEGRVCSDGVCVAEPPCQTDADCRDGGEVCVDGRCVPPAECLDDGACLAREICTGGRCVAGARSCTSDDDCSGGRTCGLDDTCEGGPECREDADCDAGQACVEPSCESVPECVVDGDCDAGEVCVNQACVMDTPGALVVCVEPEVGAGCAQPDPIVVDFGEVSVGQSVRRRVEMRNEGAAPLHVSRIGFALFSSPAFRANIGRPVPFELGPGQVNTIQIEASPTQPSSDIRAWLEVETDDAGQPLVTINILAAAVEVAGGPRARATCPPSVAVGSDVTVDGSQSEPGAAGGVLSFAWSFTQRPAGSVATLAPGQTSATYEADEIGTYRVRLEVTNRNGESSFAECETEATSPRAIRVVLTWDHAQADLDLHMSTGQFFDDTRDCYWRNCGDTANAPDWGIPGNSLDDPSLDIDDTQGFGPEQSSVERAPGNAVNIGVHYFDDHAAADPRAAATLRVFCNENLVRTMMRSFANDEVFWRAGTLHPDCSFAPLDTVVSRSRGATGPL
jgi:Cys-rich repeat protein